MHWFKLERRPVDVVALGRIALAAVFVAVVLVGFVAPWIVRYQYATLSPGDPVIVPNEGGAGHAWTVLEVRDGEAVLKDNAGQMRTFPIHAIREL